MTNLKILRHGRETSVKKRYSPAIELEKALGCYLLLVSIGKIDEKEFQGDDGEKKLKKRVECSHVVIFDENGVPFKRHDGSKFFHKYLFPKLVEPGVSMGLLIWHPDDWRAYDLDSVPDDVAEKIEVFAEEFLDDDLNLTWVPNGQKAGYQAKEPF